MKQIARSPFWLFLLLTLVLTWPLAAHSTRSLASDYGDPLFNTWVIGWVSAHISHALLGDLSALRSFWNANIFFPEPNALSFSDHMVTEALQVLPIYWLTGNLLLCYNAALLLSFALCGWAMYLLILDLSGSVPAALTAGIFFAFSEYRLTFEISHLQSLSSQWLPFGLLGLHRYIARGSRAALAGGAAALVLLNLAASFHLFYCAPFVAAFVLVDLAWQRRMRDVRAWIDLGLAAAAVGLMTVPFMWQYVLMQRQLHFERALEEVIRFSATLDQYRGSLPGFSVPLLLALVACAGALEKGAVPLFRHGLPRRGTAPFSPPLVAAAAVGVLLTFWLSLGPVVRGGGHELPVPSLYALVYDYVPGFRGIRAVARYAMLFFFFLSALAGFGIAYIERFSRRAAPLVAIAACGFFLWQTHPSPFALDRAWPFVSEGLAPVPEYLRPALAAPAIYRFVAALDGRVVLAEFPFGDDAYDLRYMYFSAAHRRPMLAGFSGVFPESYVARKAVLQRPLEQPDAAWSALAGATHAIVHAGAWPDDTGDRIVRWLQDRGAREAGRFDGVRIFMLKP